MFNIRSIYLFFCVLFLLFDCIHKWILAPISHCSDPKKEDQAKYTCVLKNAEGQNAQSLNLVFD
jgi:hypothetical protein